MPLHNYRSRQVHETLNGVNPSSSFRDMHSAKSGPNLWQIWQVFGPWTSPYGANGHMTMTVHTYRPRQFHRTLNGENPSSGYRDMGSASLAAARPAARPPGPWRQYPSSPEGWGIKIVKNSNFENLQKTLHMTHPLKLLDKMICQPELQVLQWGHGMWDGRTDRQSETNLPPQQLRCVGSIMSLKSELKTLLTSLRLYCELRYPSYCWRK